MRHLLLVSIMMLFGMAVRAQVVMNVDATQRGPLTSDYQYGLFFEEINHAGDGGLYAEMVRNRSFEEGTEGWTAVGGITPSLLSYKPLGSHTQSLSFNAFDASASNPKGVSNSGYYGMAFRTDSTYKVTVWMRGTAGSADCIQARLIADDGTTVIGKCSFEGTLKTAEFTKFTASIKASGDAKKGSLQIVTTKFISVILGYVSLFPYTWNNRENGLRPDLAQLLKDTKPSFLRFPGGCYVEGEATYDNAFQWKKTIGPVEERLGHMGKNWGYWSTDGLGYDEYLQLCEDLGAAPMFVVNIGLGHGFTLTLDETQTLVQDALDAIEYANGDASTEWGAKRIANGHAEPYNLKFIEIGNENDCDEYAERYKMFYDAIHAKYPDITIIGNVEAWGTDNPSWRNDNPVDLVDEHYYRSYTWMRDNYNKYDSYNRAIGVYNGEYAANGGSYGKYGNLNSALGEAVYMLGMEKNSDVCKLASFAPIFTHEDNPTWAYDMIHFNAASNFVTPSYHVQKLFGNNLGTQNLKWTETGNTTSNNGEVKVGVASWNTQVEYDDVKVTDANGNLIASEDFASGASNWTLGSGTWTATGGTLQQTASGTDHRAVLKTTVTGDYIYKVRARKTSGSEGFLIMFNVTDDNNYYWWNLGGWNNGAHGVEQAVNGTKTTVASTSGSIETNRWYDIEIRVSGGKATCLLDGTQVHEFSLGTTRSVYQSVQLDSKTNELIVKLVNPNATASTVQFNAKNMTLSSGTVQRLTSASGEDENTMDDPDNVTPTAAASYAVTDGHSVTLDAPAYSLSIYRFPVSNVADETTTYPQEYTDEDADKYGYLYAHMHRTQEITCYALSKTGQSWNDLLGGAEVFDTKAFTTTGGMRDAFVYRLQEGGFMLVGTDMTSKLGWTSNHIMDLMISPDLVHWTKEVKIDLESADNLKALGGITADEMTAAWAPQVIYDPVTKNYVLYYSVGFKSGYHKTYYQLIDKDLKILTEPRLYFDPGYDIIDNDIVYNAVTKQYQMVFKCESASGFNRATATHLVPQTGEESGTTVWTITSGWHVSDNNQSIEAPTQWRPMGSDAWNVSYINYSGSGYGYKTRYMDNEGLNPGDPFTISGSVAAQHGSILKITEAEYNYLLDWEQVKTLLPSAKKYYAASGNASIGEAVTLGENALENNTTFAENAKAMSEARAALEAAKKTYEDYLKEQASKGEAADLTSLLVNPDFSEKSTGWTLSGAFTQANGYVAEYWNNNTFDFHQTVTDLPAGEYEITAQSFYRYGGTEGYYNHQLGTEQLLAELYANDAAVSVLSLYDDDMTTKGGYTVSPYTYPNNVTEANTAFNTNGLYVNTLKVTLKQQGDITLGIRKTEAKSNDWCIFDNFTLKYLGDPSGISSVTADSDNAGEATYNLSGQRVSGKAQKGIYIKGGKKRVKF